MTEPRRNSKKTLMMTIAGGLAFWVTNFAISLTSIAAEYRIALSISYFPMLLEALVGGLIIGFCVSYSLLRFYSKIPAKNPILKSVILSLAALLAVEALIEVPSKFLTPTSDALHYFLVGALFNVLRILALGIVVGIVYERLNGRTQSSSADLRPKSPKV